MPFVKKNRRKPLVTGSLKPEGPGDLCFLEYRAIMDTWNESKRWTTIHEVAKDLFGNDDVMTAKLLAFLVFFSLHAMPYERKMKKKNGDIK